MTAPKEINRLIERFQENRDIYCSSEYNETQARHEFIDPLFMALGWDVNNKKGYAEAYKEVIHEDAIKVGGATKAPDYAFRIGGVRKFFVEAKRPGLNIKEDGDAAYQLRRYAWSAKLPLSIVTDFEEFAVYDCRIKPAKTDKASVGRVLYLAVDQYEKHWDEIAQIFSQDAILTGSFDKYVQSSKKKRGTAEVDTAFLKEIEAWRELLARNIALRNAELSTRELNFAVQRTIDRIIFLRICEDRGIEDYGQLMALENGTNTYQRLCRIFRRADERYNSGLFHFGREKDRLDPPDSLTLNLTIDDNLIKGIIKGLYYPESPFEFSVLPADILGHIYEQFLGKVIRLTAGHHAKVEDKPEVKKAGGVYYTPTYIVDYIVKNTVGKLLEQNTPTKVSNLRILDPACGSGSFLLGAYQTLLDWHQQWYAKHDPEKHAKGKNPRLYRTIDPSPSGRGQGEGAWRLTTAERKRILLNNIYGVDIDTQAVEVTKLSLLLKVLEGENAETLGKNLRLFHERALPDLGDNIKCGNSLIGPDFYEGKQISLLDEEKRYRINAFDWNAEFPHIFSSPSGRGQGEGSGFDAVIGNPPYGAWFREVEANYFQDYYKVFQSIRDVYICFIEKGTRLLRSDGRLSYIVPSAWLGGPRYVQLRSFLLEHQVEKVVMLPFDVFPEAYIDTVIIVVCETPPPKTHTVQTYSYGKREKLQAIALDENQYQKIEQRKWCSMKNKKFVLDLHTVQLLERMQETCSRTLGDVVRMKRGVLFNKSLLTGRPKTGNHYRYFEGDIYRYRANVKLDQWVEFGPSMKEKPKEFLWFEGTRILLRRLVNRRRRLMAMLVTETFVTNKNLYSVLPRDDRLDPHIVLAILNSRLISYLYLKQVSQATKDDFPQVTIRDILAMPFPPALRISKHSNPLLTLVERVLASYRHLATASIPTDRVFYQRQINATDKQIDKLVYKLYNLTDDEIRIVEEATKTVQELQGGRA